MQQRNGERLFCWPVKEHRITAGWQYADGSTHEAIDFGVIQGAPVYAAEDGTVDQLQVWVPGNTAGMMSYGNMLRIRHADYNGKMLQTRYAHLKSFAVRQGEFVREGQLIGYTGSTGNSTGPHLHFEVRLSGKRVNPLNWLDADFKKAWPTVRLGTYASVTVDKPVQRLQTPTIRHADVELCQTLDGLAKEMQVDCTVEEEKLYTIKFAPLSTGDAAKVQAAAKAAGAAYSSEWEE